MTVTVPGVDGLTALLRWEIDAIDLYGQVTEALGDHGVTVHLHRIRQGHESAARLLRDQIHNLGAEAVGVGTGERPLWGDNPSALLAALRDLEDEGTSEYQDVLQSPDLPQESRFVIRAELLPRCHDHLDILSGYLASEAETRH